MRGIEEHQGETEQFRLETDENGRRYTEGLSKTRNMALNFKPRIISPKMYENKTERCPLAFSLLFKSKRSVELSIMGPFYLTVIGAPNWCLVWKSRDGGEHNKHEVEQNEKKGHH